ncbi:MAG: flagellar hook basal-body protein [Bryobacterales bacterium]|nr:flagellar hook basal-body protein [Bryobacterales bacterium]
MDALLTTAASGLRARMESLDMLANNLANATSSGFKADREYYSTYIAPEALDGPEDTLPAASPVIDKNWIDFAQGSLMPTGSSLDFSLRGAGFFVVESAGGPLYTRNGNFQINSGGVLMTQAGDSVRGADGKPIRLNPNQPVTLDDQGSIRQGGQVVGRFAIVDFEDKAGLTKAGTTYFRYGGMQKTSSPTGTRIEQGRLEATNYQPAEAAIRLVSVLRQFETLQRAITLGAEMNRRAVEDVARVKE